MSERRPRPRFPGPNGLLPTVVQDARDGTVLGVAYSSAASWARRRRGGPLVLHSRSRGELWWKGATSGNSVRVVDWAVDCDGDALRVRVVPSGAYCHTGARGCFDPPGAQRRRAPTDAGIGPALERLETLVADRARHPRGGSYTTKLLKDEVERLKKLGEEATEVVVAAAHRDRREVVRESADLVYHLTVALGALGIPWAAVAQELDRRRTPRAGSSSSARARGRRTARSGSPRPRSRA